MEITRAPGSVLGGNQQNDVFQSLLLGMPPQQVLLQQGPQITQIYGGVGKTFKALTSVLTPLNVSLGVGAVAVVALGAAYTSYLRSTKEVKTASRGIGLAVAGTASEMTAAAQAGAAAAGISVSAARMMQAQFLRTGKIGSENFEALIGLSKDFATTLGIESDAAGQALAEMFSDPAQAADELYNRYGLIDGATARLAQTLAAQNRLSEAQAVLLDALPARLVHAADATTAFGRAWEAVATGASNAFNWVGKTIDRAIDGPSLDEQIQQAEKDLAIQENNARRKAEGFRVRTPDVAGARARLDALLEQRRLLEDAQKKRAEEQKGAAAYGIAQDSDANATARRQEELRNRLEALRQGQNAPGLDATQRESIARAIEATSTALDGLNTKREREAELARIEIQLQNERNPLVRADLEARRTRLELADQELTEAERTRRAEAARTREIESAIAAGQTQAADMRAETELRAKLTVQIASGAITAEDANRLLQEELTLRPLVAAAAQAEGEEKARLEGVILSLREAYASAAQANRAADQAAAFQDYLRGQSEKLQMLRVEAALIGQSEAVRQRALALAEAEQKITELRLDRNSDAANQIRAQSEAYADQTRELQKQIEAFNDLRSAGEDAVDGVIDSLLKGDVGGALDSLSEDILSTFSEIAIKNPAKNALFGTDYATLPEMGGLLGIWNTFTGGKTTAIPGLSSGTIGAQMMQVSAGTVVINGSVTGGLGAAPAVAGFAANSDTAGGDVAQQAWNYFAAKGLKPHQIAGILGNISAESGFDASAIGDGGTSFGLFQHHGSRGAGLLTSLGGVGQLGNVQGQLDYVWKELLGSENGVLQKLRAAPDVASATNAFLGFERPAGWSSATPEASAGFASRMNAAESALAKFGATTGTAQAELGTLGQGFGSLGDALASAFTGGTSSVGAGGLVQSLASFAGSALGLPGFSGGGETGGSDPSRVAGVVHEQEFVFDAAATARIGPKNLEALRRGSLRGFRTGGYVSALPASGTTGAATGGAGGSGSAATSVTVNNYSGQEVVTEHGTDAEGQPQITMTIGQQVANAVSQRGNPLRKTMQSEFSMRPRMRNRG
ncbi:phage tail length tape measure family protein [Pseudooceanicola sp. CBS1P-1]|nr:phage tail tip lysozyme [Pseudooceanicola endophyticus]MBT9382229.1 phage tail length tape measure family protein [Pseudooceanicola endophyticus]